MEPKTEPDGKRAESARFSNPLDYVLFDGKTSVVYEIMEREKPLISIHQINDTSNALKALLRKYALPEINRLDLYRIGYDDNDNPIKLTVKVRLGSDYAKIQRNLYSFRYDGRTQLHLGTHTETAPPTLKEMKLNKNFDYKISFKCGLCANHRTLNIKNHGRTRKTPHCKTHGQPMFILKVKRRHKNTEKRSYTKWAITYFIPLKGENDNA